MLMLSFCNSSIKSCVPVLVGLLTLIVSVSAQQPGELDPTFGTDGKVITLLGVTEEATRGGDIAVYPTGDFVVAGNHTTYDPNDTIEPYNQDMIVVRYKPDGALDSAFGTNGIVSMDLGMGDEYIASVALQDDDKIVLAGYAGIDPNYDFLLARINSNGTLDNSFGLNGIVVPPSSSILRNILYSVAIQTDGKIVVAGQINMGTHYDFFVARYLTDGTLDPTFGVVTTDFITFGAMGNDHATSLALAADGKIVAGGYTQKGVLADFALARYNSNGSLDNTFGAGGMVSTDFGKYDRAFSVLIAADGKILLIGNLTNIFQDSARLGVARYNPDGSLNASFGNNGKMIGNTPSVPTVWSAAVLQDTSRMVIVGGTLTVPGDFAVTRYMTNGVPDASFGSGGIVITDMFTKGDGASAIAMQGDSKILVAGQAGSATPNGIGICVARYFSHLTVGVPNREGGSAFAVYPNPAHESITLSCELAQPEPLSVRLLDLNGRLIQTLIENKMRPAGENVVRMQLPQGLVSGMYLLDIRSKGGRAVMMVTVSSS